MAKTTVIGKEELNLLRDGLEDQMLNRVPYLAKIKKNTHVGNYGDLVEDMQAYLSDEKSSSISTKRMRKLFYYTDPDLCDESKLQKPNFGVDFLDACYCYIFQENTTRSDYLRRKVQLDLSVQVDSRENNQISDYLSFLGQKQVEGIAFLASGLTAFTAIALVMIFQDYSGYSNMSSEDLRLLIPLLFLCVFFTLTLIGYLSIRAVFKLYQSEKSKHRTYVNLFVICFVSSVIIRGLKARDSYFVAFFLDRKANGLLGQPNFEVLATSIAISLSSILLVDFFLKNRVYSNLKILSFSMKSALSGAFAFALVYLLFRALVFFGLIIEKGHIISSAVFRYSFSHPERVLGVCIIIFAALLFILKGVKMAATNKYLELNKIEVSGKNGV